MCDFVVVTTLIICYIVSLSGCVSYRMDDAQVVKVYGARRVCQVFIYFLFTFIFLFVSL